MALAEIFAHDIAARLNFRDGALPDAEERVERAITDLYTSLARSKPAIIWCHSILQFVTVPSLLIGLLHSDMWKEIAHDFLEAPDANWDDSWDFLWANGGYQLLNGMYHTSRIGRLFPGLESTIRDVAKEQLLSWLKSGRLEKFESRLNRDMYRRFWGLHLWFGRNFAAQRLEVLCKELDKTLLNDGGHLEQEWSQFTPFAQHVATVYDSALRSMIALLNRMGAEPASQVGNSIWLPFAAPELTLCQMWKTTIAPDAFPEFQDDFRIWDELGSNLLGLICIEDVAIVCAKPEMISLDEMGRLHAADGPAMRFADGCEVHAWHGVAVEKRIIENPETITPKEIQETENIEVRRVLIDRYGLPRYLEESGAEAVSEDEAGVLYRIPIANDEPLVMVKVINSTAEPDGTFKEYFLRVPPFVRTAKEAVAWTFGFDEGEYAPMIES